MADMKDNEDWRAKLMEVAKHHVENLAYTVVFDTTNEIIEMGADPQIALECGNRVISRYVDGDIKVRKKPVPRAKAPKKQGPVDLMTAATRKAGRANEVEWVRHPESSNYSYTLQCKLANGYPVMNNSTGQICGVVTDEATLPLSVTDAKVAQSYRFEVDPDSIVQ